MRRSAAAVQRAEADLAEQERLLRQAENLMRDQILARDQLEAAESRVRMAQAALAAGRRPTWASRRPSSPTPCIRAPFTGVVVKKMAEVGESVAPIPPGVNLSTSSGAIVALADLDTLEVEADVAESNVARLGRRAAGGGHGRGLPRPEATARCCGRSSPPPTAPRPRCR